MREDQVTVIVNGTVLRNSTPYIPRKLSLFCSSLALIKRIVITIVMITFFSIGLQTVKFGLKTIYNSRSQPDFEGFLRALRFPPSLKLTPSSFQFERMHDLPKNHFRGSGASWVNIINFAKVLAANCSTIVFPHSTNQIIVF